MLKLFTDHPTSVGETYFEHLLTAATFSTRLLIASIVCLIHSVFPFLFKKEGSKMITDLYCCMVTARDKRMGGETGAESILKKG